MATIAENLNRIADAKEAIKGAIIDKGVQVPSDAKIDEYSTFIGQIQGGGGEDTLKMYIDGTIVKDGVLDLSNYDTLNINMFREDEPSKWRDNVNKIILSPRLERIPEGCFYYLRASEIVNIDKVKYIERENIESIVTYTLNLNECVEELGNIGSADVKTKIYGENIKVISLKYAYSLENLYVYSNQFPEIKEYDNVSSWVSDKSIYCHCWMDGATTNILVTDKDYSVNYLEELISQTYTGESEFDVDKIKCTLTLPYSFAYTEDGEEKTKDIVYNKELKVYPVNSEVTKVVPITTAQSTDEFTLNIKPYQLKAPEMDLFYEFEVMEDCVLTDTEWSTEGVSGKRLWEVWYDNELTEPNTRYEFKKGEIHTLGFKVHDEYILNNWFNIFYSSSTRDYLKTYYVEINKNVFDSNVTLQHSKWNTEKFATFVFSVRNNVNWEFAYCAKDVIYLDGVEDGCNLTYNGSPTCNFYVCAETLNECGSDIREYRWYTERPSIYLKETLVNQLWDEDEYFKRCIYKYDIE